jgi:hypothetical protein
MRTSLPETHGRAVAAVVEPANHRPGTRPLPVRQSGGHLGPAERVDQTFLEFV